MDRPRGPDARGGNYPLGTQILGNVINDIGIWQKQSSMWFQATTAQSLVKGNVHFNGAMHLHYHACTHCSDR